MKERVIYFDYLRILATIAVIFLHVAAQNWYTTDVNTLNWHVFNIYDSIVRWGVPIFIMISGALFLEKEINIKQIYSKNILRLLTAFIFWSIVYSLVTKGSTLTILSNIITGYYHMWFIPMIIGLYISLPIIKNVIKSDKTTKYFLVLSFIFVFFIPQIIQLGEDFGDDRMKILLSSLNKTIKNIQPSMFLGFTGYFIAGYFINKIKITKKKRIPIYLLGIIGTIITIMLNAYLSIKKQTPVSTYYGNFCVNVLMQSIAIFVFFKYSKLKSNNIIKKLSKYSFGAYLIHVLIIEQLNTHFALNTLSFNPIISVPIISIIVCIISFLISAIINKIPILKNFIV